jgi:outer membrane protein
MRSSIALGIVSAVALAAAWSGAAIADDQVGLGAGNLLVHARIVGVFPDATGHDTLLNGKIATDDYAIPEVDASYFFTDYLAAEIIAGTTKHDVKDELSGSNLKLGHVWLLPPTLTAQVHPFGHSIFDFYAGAGVNYTFFYGSGGSQNIAGLPTKVTYKNGYGTALEMGINYDVQGPWYVNVDVKKIYLTTSADVELAGAKITHARVAINPWLAGVGVGYRF